MQKRKIAPAAPACFPAAPGRTDRCESISARRCGSADRPGNRCAGGLPAPPAFRAGVRPNGHRARGQAGMEGAAAEKALDFSGLFWYNLK